MLTLLLGKHDAPLRVLCIGAHSDDIEIGCAGTLLRLLRSGHRLDVTWVVACASGERGIEATGSARALLRGAARLELMLGDLSDSQLPADVSGARDFFRTVREKSSPDLVFTHRLEDRHQDHRFVAELTWQMWRNHLILEYEIPKYDGDLGRPNAFFQVPKVLATRKIRHLMQHFATQRSKHWFSEDTFRGLMRLRGVECRADSGLAEAFHMRKAVL